MRLLRSSTLRCLEALHAMASFIAESPELTREGFRRFVRGPLERLPELQAFEWIPRVTGAERAAYEATAGFRFTELDADGRVAVAEPRALYHPVYFAEPAHENRLALGFDVGSQPERRQALQRALTTGAPAASAPVRLAQEHAAREHGMLVFTPVLDRDTDGDAPPRGFAVAVLRIRDFMQPALAELVHDGFDVRVYDRERPKQVLFALGEAAPARLQRQAVLDVAGRHLALSFVPTERFVRQHLGPAPWLFASAGLLFGCLIAAHVARSMRYTHDVERRVLERAAANQRLQAEIATRKQAQEEAARAREAQAQFLANVSHEIRTPLNAIIGYAQILQRADTDRALHSEALTTIGQSGQHLLTLLDEVIDLTKIEAGHVQLRPCDFDLHALIESVALMLRPKCEQKGLALKVELNDAASWQRGDQGKLRQVLINLLGNALKFTERG
ncbi:MAG TPA: CHASE domain-containing protein, partial [Polyangiales bacterium]|nr:CHASE domain-containing protein [Polyangiales bacterium]